jgi:LEA14-like dessication related protein
MRFHQPEVRLETVRLGSLGLSGGTLYAGLIVTNPNTYELRSSALRFTLEMRGPASSDENWMRIAEGELDRELSIMEGDSAVIEIPVDFNWSGVGTGLRSVIERGHVNYRLAGDLTVIRPVRRSVPFRRTGQVDLARAR